MAPLGCPRSLDRHLTATHSRAGSRAREVDGFAPWLGAADEPVDLCVEVVGVSGAEGADGARRVDQDVRRYSADSELFGVRPSLVEEDRSLDAPELAVVLCSLSRVASFPDIDQDHVQTRPVCLASAQPLEQGRLRITGASPAGEKVEDVLSLRPFTACAHYPGSQVG